MARMTPSEAFVETLAAHGFNRVSVGVQDLSPRVQKAINRIQPRELTEAAARVLYDEATPPDWALLRYAPVWMLNSVLKSWRAISTPASI